MATLNSVQASAARTGFNAVQAGDLVTTVGEFDIAVDNAGTAIASADIVNMVKLPVDHVIVDCILDTDVIASGVVDVGLDGGAELITGQSTASAAAVRADVAGFTRIAPSTSEQMVSVTFTTGSAATTGVFRLSVMSRASDHGI